MNEKYVHLKVLFSQTQPEILRSQILAAAPLSRLHPSCRISCQAVEKDAYLHLAHSVPELMGRTQDELIQCFHSLQEFINTRPNGGILHLLEKYAADVLLYRQGEPICRQQYLFSWRDDTLHLGQDLFTCAGMAALDLRENCITQNFLWAPIIRTDRVDLQSILERGLAENHYHMNGSTQIFALSWAYLMNHPESIRSYYDTMQFQEDLNGTYSFGTQDNRISWVERIQEAAWIRNQFFRSIRGHGDDSEMVRNYIEFTHEKKGHLSLVTNIRASRLGACRRAPDEQWRRLDYALCQNEFQSPDLAASSRRLLAGERYLLYHCFRRCYDGTFSPKQCDLFYLYLLYRIRFRKELIQANGRAGFRNFAEHQDRKANGWGDDSLYWEESCRLSAANALFRPGRDASAPFHQELPVRQLPAFGDKERCVTSLELRVMPQNTPEGLKKAIRETDQYILRGMNVRPAQESLASSLSHRIRYQQLTQYLEESAPFFYVLHFAKEPQQYISESRAKNKRPCLRNGALRVKVRTQALATAEALNKSSYLCSRIRGIDACNHEIGCRPEVFATAFRYLRTLPFGTTGKVQRKRYFPMLSATYHAGEDFLDLTDGLRAIDEAICFLNLNSGDRLGHALALGVWPEEYYALKHHSVKLPAQDLLDNLVWLLFRTLEWNIPVPSSLRSKLETQAASLLYFIYDRFPFRDQDAAESFSLAEYYEAWKLRGDDPQLYRLVKADHCKYQQNLIRLLGKEARFCASAYQKAMLNQMNWRKDSRFEVVVTEEEYLFTRMNEKIAFLVYQYFYDPKVRWNGQMERDFQITADYVNVIYALQNHMMGIIAQKGMAIECNPSSNQLIGSFKTYQNHPIFRFNHAQIPLERGKEQRCQLQVSINTDDLGVFDTSLENEYALLYSALQQDTNELGQQKIGDTMICCYLETIREMGHQVTFPKSNPSGRKRLVRNK